MPGPNMQVCTTVLHFAGAPFLTGLCGWALAQGWALVGKFMLGSCPVVVFPYEPLDFQHTRVAP